MPLSSVLHSSARSQVSLYNLAVLLAASTRCESALMSEATSPPFKPLSTNPTISWPSLAASPSSKERNWEVSVNCSWNPDDYNKLGKPTLCREDTPHVSEDAKKFLLYARTSIMTSGKASARKKVDNGRLTQMRSQFLRISAHNWRLKRFMLSNVK